MIVQCATFSKSLNSRNINKSVSDIRIRIRFPFQSRFWISVSGCKLTILPDIQPANRIVIISVSDGQIIACQARSDVHRNLLKMACKSKSMALLCCKTLFHKSKNNYSLWKNRQFLLEKTFCTKNL